jgi:uncharacterized protein YjbJ (UPF0337 family)
MLDDPWETPPDNIGEFSLSGHTPPKGYTHIGLTTNGLSVETQWPQFSHKHGGEAWDKQRVEEKVDDAVRRAKRQVKKWTDETKAQAEDAAHEVKGKAEHALDKMKHAAHDAKNKVTG